MYKLSVVYKSPGWGFLSCQTYSICLMVVSTATEPFTHKRFMDHGDILTRFATILHLIIAATCRSNNLLSWKNRIFHALKYVLRCFSEKWDKNRRLFLGKELIVYMAGSRLNSVYVYETWQPFYSLSLDSGPISAHSRKQSCKVRPP